MTPSIMFHHFHDLHHYKSQGSLGSDEIRQILLFLLNKFQIISPFDYLYKHSNNTLQENEICLTFDDGLLCQYDVALPVLESLSLQAFWFIYSSAIEKKEGNLEIYRYFITNYFNSQDDFYSNFFINVADIKKDFDNIKSLFEKSNYLNEFKFYSFNDRFFRFIRDKILIKNQYYELMDSLLNQYNCDKKIAGEKLWMNEQHLKTLISKGHVIGAHSYSHPTNLARLSENEQFKEYSRNVKHLEDITGKKIEVMSHPCNSYSEDTLQILKDLNIKVGFRSNYVEKNFSNFELPRIDHTEILESVKLQMAWRP
jgi:peptidoglycan/xylan/chitin deacetylase (PgdA/CDA1 family)